MAPHRDDWDGSERRRLPAEWLSQEMQRLRGDMRAGFYELGQKFEQHAKDDLVIERRVLVIETQRAEEAKQATKRGAVAGIIAGAAAGLIANLVKGMIEKP